MVEIDTLCDAELGGEESARPPLVLGGLGGALGLLRGLELLGGGSGGGSGGNLLARGDGAAARGARGVGAGVGGGGEVDALAVEGRVGWKSQHLCGVGWLDWFREEINGRSSRDELLVCF